MGISQETVILHGPFQERERTTSKGTKRRMTIEVKSTPLLHSFDEMRIGEGPALAIQEIIQEQIGRISERVSDATLLQRKYDGNAFRAGKRWARKRYAGGRIGDTPPTTSDKKWNHSGRFKQGLSVRENTTEKAWTINVPANRLNRATADTAELTMMTQQLQRLVPALKDQGSLARDRRFTKAVEQAWDDMITSAEANGLARMDKLKRDRFRAALNALGFSNLSQLV